MAGDNDVPRQLAAPETDAVISDIVEPVLALLREEVINQTRAPLFYNRYNISDELFFHFNGFNVPPTSTELALNATISESTNITGEPDLSKFLEALPNDRVGFLGFLFLFSFATVFGNSLVILAVIRERYLHTATNYFITSLAVADCLVGLVVMPFSALYEVLENTWFFGTDWCDIWRSLDVLFSTASILNLCVISLDRYWAITDPFSYPMRMTVKRAAGLIAAVWICSSAISFPAIVWWRAARDGEMPAYKCTFTEHLGYLVFSSTISFYLPLLVMVFTYCRIYRAAVIQTRSLKIGTKQVLMASGELQLTLRIHRGGTTRDPTTNTNQVSGGGGGGGGGGGSLSHSNSHSHHHHHNHSGGTTTSTPEEPDDEPLTALHNNGLARHRHMGKNFSLSRKLAKFAKEKKAAKTLGIVMGVFIICWLPFFVVNLLSGFCVKCIKHEEIVLAVVTWLGWINSSMNPVIYACWSRDFRRAFVRLLCMCCPRKIRRKYQPTMRSKSQPSSCSTCSGSSNCGVAGGRSSHQYHSSAAATPSSSQRSCTRCQSFHRHHHRARRRSSGMQLRSDFSSTSAVNNAAKTIVTITAPPAAAASASTLHLGSCRPSSVSTLTLASVPPTLLLEASLAGSALKGGSVSAANTPLAPATKHTSFALTPTNAMGATNPSSGSGSGHHVSFMPLPLPMMGVKRLRDSHSSLSSPTAETGAATSSAPSLIMEVMEKPPTQAPHAALELRQSIQSQITTLEDVDDVEHSSRSSSDDESESVGLALVQTTPQLECQAGMASSSSSASVK